jgi:hypothetical protein
MPNVLDPFEELTAHLCTLHDVAKSFGISIEATIEAYKALEMAKRNSNQEYLLSAVHEVLGTYLNKKH